MMSLAAASSYFDRTEVTDPFTGSLLCLAQIDPFDDSKRDAFSAYRRLLSTAPSVQIPEHRSIRALGQVWLVGEGEPDGLEDLHRRKYVIAPAKARLQVANLAGYLAGQASQEVYAAPYWNRDAKQMETSSAPVQLFDVFTPVAVGAQKVLWSTDAAYLTLSPRPAASGLASAFALKLDHRAEAGLVVTQAYSPAAGALTVTATTPVQLLRVRWQSLFEYDAQDDVKHANGDVSIVLPPGTAVDTASRIQAGGHVYQVVSSSVIAGTVVAHARKIS